MKLAINFLINPSALVVCVASFVFISTLMPRITSVGAFVGPMLTIKSKLDPLGKPTTLINTDGS